MHRSIDRKTTLETLEARVHLTATPTAALGSAPKATASIVKPLAAGPTLTLADRQELLRNWQGSNLAQLTADLNSGNTAAFDQHLLDYMKTRTTADYFFAPSDATGIL